MDDTRNFIGEKHQFRVFSDKIETPGDGVIIFRGMHDHTSESIKSLEGFRIAWIDEAQSLSARSLSLLRPTIRAKGSELWASWNPYNVPLGGALVYFGSTAPNSSFVFPYGQAISRTTYATLFTLFGTTYGSGDGSTTFNVPDCRGRVIAGKDDMGGSAASRLTSTYFGTGAVSLGAVGGSESTTLTLAQLPTGITSNGSNSISVTSTDAAVAHNATYGSASVPGGGQALPYLSVPSDVGAITSTGSNSINVTSNNTSGSAHRTVPPTIIANILIRIL